MRNVANLFFVVLLASLLTGCPGTSGIVGGGDGFGVAGWNNRTAPTPGYYRGGQRVVDPCQPFQAGGLMSWATELETQQRHQRGANVSVSPDGRVQCSSHEAGSSQYQGGQQRQYRPAAPAQYQGQAGQSYRPAPAPRYQEPVIQGWSQ